jgi:hypothetical protein
MATPEQVRAWAAENRAWSGETANRALAAALCRLANELDALAPEIEAGAPVACKLNLPGDLRGQLDRKRPARQISFRT